MLLRGWLADVAHFNAVTHVLALAGMVAVLGALAMAAGPDGPLSAS